MKQLINLFLLTLIISLTSFTLKDKVKFKDGTVLVNDSKCMYYERLSALSTKLMTIDSSETIYLKNIHFESHGVKKQYCKVTFVKQQKSLTSMSYIFTKKILVNKLIKSGVIKDCGFDVTKVDDFIAAYDESIDETLIRHR